MSPRPCAAPRGGGSAILAIPLLILALVAETLWFAPLDETSAAPARNPAPLPLAAVNPFGAHVFLEREVDRFKKDKTLDLFRQADLHWVKQEFPWSELEFAQNKYYDDNNSAVSWDKFDGIVSQIEARGLDVIARLDRAPAWARPPGASSNAPPANVADFGDFVAAFVQHYKGRIRSSCKSGMSRTWKPSGCWASPWTRKAMWRCCARRPRAPAPSIRHCHPKRAAGPHQRGLPPERQQQPARDGLPQRDVRRGRGALVRHRGGQRLRLQQPAGGSPRAQYL